MSRYRLDKFYEEFTNCYFSHFYNCTILGHLEIAMLMCKIVIFPIKPRFCSCFLICFLGFQHCEHWRTVCFGIFSSDTHTSWLNWNESENFWCFKPPFAILTMQINMTTTVVMRCSELVNMFGAGCSPDESYLIKAGQRTFLYSHTRT